MGYRHPNDYEPVGPVRRTGPVDAPAASSLPSDWFAAPAPDDDLFPAAPIDTPAVAALAPDAVSQRTTGAAAPMDRRGHLLSFAGLFLFNVVLYFRPYELFPALSGITAMAFWIAVPTLVVFGITQFTRAGNLTARPREINLVLLLVVTALLSIPLALNRAEAWDEFNGTFIKAVLMFIVMVNVARTERRLRALLLLSLAVSCFLAVNAMNDYRLGRLDILGERVVGAIGGMFGNPNDMALHLVTMIPVAVAFCFTKRNPLAKLAYAACAALLVAGIVASFSRGGFLGLIGAGGVLAWKLGRRHKLAVGACVIAAILAFVVLAPGGYASRLGTIANASTDLTGSSSQRQALLIRSLQVTARHPLFGVGMGNFHIVSIHEFVSHNAFTQVSADLGLTAFVLYVLFLFAPLRRLRALERTTFAARREARFYYYFAVGLQAALVGYMVSSFFAAVAYNFYVYYLVGYAVCLRQLAAATHDANDAQATAAHATDMTDAPADANAAAPVNNEFYA